MVVAQKKPIAAHGIGHQTTPKTHWMQVIQKTISAQTQASRFGPMPGTIHQQLLKMLEPAPL